MLELLYFFNVKLLLKFSLLPNLYESLSLEEVFNGCKRESFLENCVVFGADRVELKESFRMAHDVLLHDNGVSLEVIVLWQPQHFFDESLLVSHDEKVV